ncbi:MAG: DUF4177 domain-containing protein [Ferruginibacter sp.]
MKKFEYRILTVPTKGWMKYRQDFDKLLVELNELGKQGWEITTALPNMYQTGSYSTNIIILKREINR